VGHYINGWWYPDEQVVLGADGEPRLRRGVRPFGAAAPEPGAGAPAIDAVEDAEDADGAAGLDPALAPPAAPEARETKVIEPGRPGSPIRTKGEGRG